MQCFTMHIEGLDFGIDTDKPKHKTVEATWFDREEAKTEEFGKTTELVLNAIPGASDLDAILPIDTVIVLPPLPVQPKNWPVINLWD